MRTCKKKSLIDGELVDCDGLISDRVTMEDGNQVVRSTCQICGSSPELGAPLTLAIPILGTSVPAKVS